MRIGVPRLPETKVIVNKHHFKINCTDYFFCCVGFCTMQAVTSVGGTVANIVILTYFSSCWFFI